MSTDGTPVKVEAAYLVGIHRYSFRAGQPARVIGVEVVTPDKGDEPRPCFRIEFIDGNIDWVAIHDKDNYRLISASQLAANDIPKVIE